LALPRQPDGPPHDCRTPSRQGNFSRGAIDALRERGMLVPDDVAVIGFDNWEIVAAATRPPLTSVDMNLSALGREAGLTLLSLVAGDIVEPGVRDLIVAAENRVRSVAKNLKHLADRFVPRRFRPMKHYWRERLQPGGGQDFPIGGEPPRVRQVESNFSRFGNPPRESASASNGISHAFHPSGRFWAGNSSYNALNRVIDGKEVVQLRADSGDSTFKAAKLGTRPAVAGYLLENVADEADVELLGQEIGRAHVEMGVEAGLILCRRIDEVVGHSHYRRELEGRR
jgi:hypothetical protein